MSSDRRSALSTSDLIDMVTGRDFSDQKAAFHPAATHPGNFEPSEQVMMAAAILWRAGEGREFVEWILDLTMRAPYPVTSQEPHDLQFAAAKHQARAAVGETVLLAIRKGEQLLDQNKGS
jgi:hypothetical protein